MNYLARSLWLAIHYYYQATSQYIFIKQRVKFLPFIFILRIYTTKLLKLSSCIRYINNRKLY